MDAGSPAGEVGVRVPQQDHYPSVVHRFGADSDWTIGEAGRTGRIMGRPKIFKVLLVLCHVEIRASSEHKMPASDFLFVSHDGPAILLSHLIREHETPTSSGFGIGDMNAPSPEPYFVLDA